MASRQERIDQLRHHLERMEALEKEEARRADARRKIVLGGALIKLLESRPDLKKALAPQLSRLITRAADQNVVSGFLSNSLAQTLPV